jgi:hypothetical protein
MDSGEARRELRRIPLPGTSVNNPASQRLDSANGQHCLGERTTLLRLAPLPRLYTEGAKNSPKEALGRELHLENLPGSPDGGRTWSAASLQPRRGQHDVGRLGVSDSVLGQIFALVTWALLITLTVTLVSWIVNRALAR